MNRVLTFIRNRWFRVTLSSALIIWTIFTLSWMLTAANTPVWVVGHATYDLIVEGTLATSLWLDVVKKKVP